MTNLEKQILTTIVDQLVEKKQHADIDMSDFQEAYTYLDNTLDIIIPLLTTFIDSAEVETSVILKNKYE